MVKSDKYAGVCYNLLANGDKSYYVRFVVNGKRHDIKIGKHSEGIREAFCFNKRSELIHEAKFGSIIDDRMSLNTLVEEYHTTKTTNSSYDEMVSRFNLTIKPFFKNKLINKITEADCIAFRNSLMKTLTGSKGKGDRLMAHSTINAYMTQLSSILKYGVNKNYIKENVSRNVKPLRVDNRRTRYLELSELKELVECVEYDDDLLMYVEMSMSTGGRMGAVMQLKKRDINMSNKTVSLIDEKGREYYTAFINPRVYKLLEKKFNNLKPNDSIYNSKQRAMQRKMKEILDTLFNDGLDVNDRKNRVVLHTLRHTFASHLAINGTPIFTIQKLLNHKDIKQTMRYAKLSPDSGRDNVTNIWL